MPRIARMAPGGMVYHAINRAVARLPLFEKEADYAAFEEVLAEAQQKHPTRILAYCLMPNHWHFVLWPQEDGELTDFLRWLTHTHTMRWHAHHHTGGTGHLYQGRFKSFPVQTDEHFLAVARYVERNALRAKLTPRAEAWRWSSVWRRIYGDARSRAILSRWPLPMPDDWLQRLNRVEPEGELDAVRRALRRGAPFGGERWQKNTAVRLGLEFTLRPRGRPRAEE
ncbi:MAG: transposase [Pirellulales bacterium]|nr:transposase [Pirellulales bacterium]